MTLRQYAKGKNYRQLGFTLIELLVVIAIIGILASIILASLNTARAKGRDARRISDIKQIQLALELYYDACGNYPANIYNTANNVCGSVTSGVGLVQGGYISAVPYDPSGSVACTDGTQPDCYSYAAICTTGAGCSVPGSYHLGASLETSNSALASDSDACPGGTAGTACPAGQGSYHDGPVANLVSNWNGGTDFSGLSYAAGGSYCNSTPGTAYPGTPNQETCYDVTP